MSRGDTTYTTHWDVFDDADAVAEEAAMRILAVAAQALSERERFRIVLAGGTTPAATYRKLVGADTDWSRWEVYFGDERCLPPDHAERNSVMAATAFLDQVPIPSEQVYPIAAEQGAEAAAAQYASLLADRIPFDVVLLGMGEDGHTASLFPGHVHDATQLVHPVHNAPKPPPDRVSLAMKALTNTRHLMILVTGDGKREAVAQWRQGGDLPIAAAAAPDTVVLIDRAAWGDA